MLFTFKSDATGALIMLEVHAKHILSLIGKDPSAPGIVMPEQIPVALQAIELACQQQETQLQAQEQARKEQKKLSKMSRNVAKGAEQPSALSPSGSDGASNAPDADAPRPILLRQRSHTLVEMLRLSLAENVPVVWSL